MQAIYASHDISYAITYLFFQKKIQTHNALLLRNQGDALLTRCERSKGWCDTYFDYSHCPVKPAQQLVITKSSLIKQALLVQRCGFKTSVLLIKSLQAACIVVSL